MFLGRGWYLANDKNGKRVVLPPSPVAPFRLARGASSEAARVIKVQASIVIPAPPSEVFAIMCDPYKMTQGVIDENTDLPGGLRRTRSHRVRADGSVVNTEQERLKSVPDKQTVTRTRATPFRKRGRLEWLSIYTLEAIGEGTRLTISRKVRARPWYLARHAGRKQKPTAAQALGRSLARIRAAIVSGSVAERSVEPPPRSVPIIAARGRSRIRVSGRLAVLAITAIVVVVTVTGVTSNNNSPKAVATAYVNAILGGNPEGACSLVNPVHERDCEAYFAPAQLLPSLGASGQANAVNLVMHGNKAVVSISLEICIVSECEWSHNPHGVLPSSSLSFDRAYSNWDRLSCRWTDRRSAAAARQPIMSTLVAGPCPDNRRCGGQ